MSDLRWDDEDEAIDGELDLAPLTATPRDVTPAALAPATTVAPPAPVEVPPWMNYEPERDPRTGRIVVDVRRELAAGIDVNDYALRLRANGMVELATQFMADLVSDANADPAIRFRAAKDILDRGVGAPVTSIQQTNHTVNNLMIVMDVDDAPKELK